MKKRSMFICCFMIVCSVLFVWNAGIAEVFHVSNPQQLGDALNTASTNGEDDTIYLAAGLYEFTQSVR